MSSAFLLFRLSLKRAWPLLAATGLLLAAVQAFRVLIAASMHDAGQFDQLCALLAMFAPPEVPWPSARQTAALAFSLGMLVVCWSGMAMAFGAACRRGVASTATSLLAFAALLLDWAHRLWPPLDCIAWLSPFFYFNPYELVAGDPLRSEDLLVLWAIATTGYILAYLIMSLRDISR